jgi:hypothetical protein
VFYDELIARVSKLHMRGVFLYSHVIPIVQSTSEAAIIPDKLWNSNCKEGIPNFSAET